MVSSSLRVLLAANWGLGERLLAALLDCPDVSLQGVITRCPAPDNDDPWADAVRARAAAAGLPIWEEKSLTHPALADLVRNLNVDVLFLHAYMHRLRQDTYSAARKGTVNIHASLLPRHRGPAPHHWTLKNREPETGLTSHFVDDGLDTGPIIHQVRICLNRNETLPDLLETLKKAAPHLVRGTVRNLLDPGFRPVPQDASLVTHAPVMESRLS